MKLVFFTGSGISQESGIPTFRDRFGIWKEIDPMDVAHKNAWKTNKSLVLEFHNRLRRMTLSAQPNDAHRLIAQLELKHEILIVTQNVDDLHERAGSTNVTHLHGNIMESRSTLNPNLTYSCLEDLNIGDRCERGSQLRPNVVWFGEEINIKAFNFILQEIKECDFLVIIGTSLEVSPANELVKSSDVSIIVIDPNPPIDIVNKRNIHIIQKRATDGVRELIDFFNR
jgi:NAD-dependent deacetylase